MAMTNNPRCISTQPCLPTEPHSSIFHISYTYAARLLRLGTMCVCAQFILCLVYPVSPPLSLFAVKSSRMDGWMDRTKQRNGNNRSTTHACVKCGGGGERREA